LERKRMLGRQRNLLLSLPATSVGYGRITIKTTKKWEHITSRNSDCPEGGLVREPNKSISCRQHAQEDCFCLGR
jgi:hypothetical protein